MERFNIVDPPFPSDCEEQTDKSKKMRYSQVRLFITNIPDKCMYVIQ